MPLQNFETVCKKSRESLKALQQVRDKEIQKQQIYEKVKVNEPANKNKIANNQSELEKSRMESSITFSNTRDEAEKFEMKKVADLKRCLTDFLKIQMSFHAKALSLYTTAYNHIETIDEQGELETFRKNF